MYVTLELDGSGWGHCITLGPKARSTPQAEEAQYLKTVMKPNFKSGFASMKTSWVVRWERSKSS